MKKQLMKILFSLVLMFSLALCIGTTSKADEGYTAKVSNISLSAEYGSLYLSWDDGAYYTEIYINDVYNNTVYNYSSDGTSSTCWHYVDIGTAAGKYTVKLVPYNNYGEAGTAKTKSITVDIGTDLSYEYGTTSHLTQTGYNQPMVYINLYSEDSSYIDHYEIQRYDSAKEKYVTVGSTNGSWDTFWDRDLPGLGNYSYRVRAVGGTNSYITEAKVSDWVKLGKVKVELAQEYLYIYLDDDRKPVLYFSDYGAPVSGYKIYRATSKYGDYKLIKTVTGVSSYKDNSAKKNTTYYYKVRPYYYNLTTGKTYYGPYFDSVGVKTALSYVSLILTEKSSTSVKASWSKVEGATGYELYYRENIKGESYKLLTTTKNTSYTKTGLSKNSSYVFMIRAYQVVNGKKTYSDFTTNTVSTGIHSPDVRISSTTATYESGVYTVKTKLTWDKIYGASKYVIYKDDGETRTKIKTIDADATRSYTYTQKVSKSSPAEGVDIIVVAYKSKSLQAETSMRVYPYLKLTSSVSVSKKNATSVTISWKKVTGANYYEVYKCLGNGYDVYVGATSKLSIVDSNLTPGVEYTYTVRALNTTLDLSDCTYEYYYTDEYTNMKTYTLSVVKPTIKSGSNSASKKATIKWSGTSIAEEYKIYRATSKNGTYKLVATVDADKTSYTDSGLTVGKTYYYKVVASATNEGGLTVNSAKSDYKEIKISK